MHDAYGSHILPLPCDEQTCLQDVSPGHAGVRKTKVPPAVVAAIICVRYVILPLVGVAVVRAARDMGFLPPDKLYQYTLMMQFAVPPAMSIGKFIHLCHWQSMRRKFKVTLVCAPQVLHGASFLTNVSIMYCRNDVSVVRCWAGGVLGYSAVDVPRRRLGAYRLVDHIHVDPAIGTQLALEEDEP